MKKNCSFSAICIQETWLKDGDDTSLFQIPGYHLVHLGSQCSEHGGLIIYLQNTFTYYLKNIHHISARWEGLFIDVYHENIKTKTVIGNIYRPPRRNNCNNEIDLFLNEFRPALHKLEKEKSPILLSGDFDLNLLDITDREKIQEYHDLHVSNGFYPKITLPTRFAKKSCSLIDQIYFRCTNKAQHSISGILFEALSDHFPCSTNIDLGVCYSR